VTLEVRQFRALNAPEEAVPKSVFEGLFPRQVVVALAQPMLVDDWLYPDELARVALAVPKRRAEFATARMFARNAQAELGIGPCSLVLHHDRSRRWPDGTLGTISHTDSYCAVAVALSCQALGLALDVERNVLSHHSGHTLTPKPSNGGQRTSSALPDEKESSL
jgi:4'-phosphopantetheinyl transferase EntD